MTKRAPTNRTGTGGNRQPASYPFDTSRQRSAGDDAERSREFSSESPPRPSAESTASSAACDSTTKFAPFLAKVPEDQSSEAFLPAALAADAVMDLSADCGHLNPAPESLEPIKPRDWSFVEEEQARKQASGASKRRKDPLQKSDVATGGRLPSIDHSALYSGGNLCMMLSMKDKVQAQRVLDALRELHARKGRRGNTGDLMEKHHLTSHIYFGNLSTQVLQYYCARYRLATPTHSSHERLADAVARHFNAVEPPLETDVLTNLIHHKLPL